MRQRGVNSLVMALFLAGAAVGQSETEGEVKAILDRATKALGAAERLAQYRGVSWKGKGIFRLADIVLEFERDAFVQGYDCFRQDLALGANQNSLTLVVTRSEGWIKAGKTMPLPMQA